MSCDSDNVLYIGNDHDFGFDDVTPLTLRADGSAVTGATVTGQLFEANAAGWPSTTNIGAASTAADEGGGQYLGVIEASEFSSVTLGQKVWLKVVVTSGGKDAVWWTRLEAVYRIASE